MGQKVHPYGFRLGFNKTWRSRWFSDREYAKLLHEDLALRRDLKKRFAHAGVSRIETERAANNLKIDIYTLAAWHHHRPEGDRGRQAETGSAEAHQPPGLHQHPGDPEAGARGSVDRRIGGGAARAARRLPPRDAQGRRVGAAVRGAGDQGPRGWPVERRRDRPLGVVPARPAAAPDAACGHRLRVRRGQHDVRPRSASRCGFTRESGSCRAPGETRNIGTAGRDALRERRAGEGATSC